MLVVSSGFEGFVFAKASRRVVQMSENTIFLCKDSIVSSHGFDMVNVAIDGSRSAEIIDLRDTSGAHETFGKTLSVAHSWSELVFFMGENVVLHTTQVIGSFYLWGFR